jgi:ribosomal protein S18 acetylase RimI-like enzyme
MTRKQRFSAGSSTASISITSSPKCDFLIIERPNGASFESIGRLYVDRWPDQIRLVDIALLPAHRRAGHGPALLQSILDEGQASGLAVSIHVEANNPAMTLYRRLGFVHVDTNGVYHLMRWEPGGER